MDAVDKLFGTDSKSLKKKIFDCVQKLRSEGIEAKEIASEQRKFMPRLREWLGKDFVAGDDYLSKLFKQVMEETRGYSQCELILVWEILNRSPAYLEQIYTICYRYDSKLARKKKLDKLALEVQEKGFGKVSTDLLEDYCQEKHYTWETGDGNPKIIHDRFPIFSPPDSFYVQSKLQSGISVYSPRYRFPVNVSRRDESVTLTGIKLETNENVDSSFTRSLRRQLEFMVLLYLGKVVTSGVTGSNLAEGDPIVVFYGRDSEYSQYVETHGPSIHYSVLFDLEEGNIDADDLFLTPIRRCEAYTQNDDCERKAGEAVELQNATDESVRQNFKLKLGLVRDLELELLQEDECIDSSRLISLVWKHAFLCKTLEDLVWLVLCDMCVLPASEQRIYEVQDKCCSSIIKFLVIDLPDGIKECLHNIK